MAKISIVGTGTWGIALAMQLRRNGHEVTAWSKIPEEIEYLKEHHAHKSLPGVILPDGIVYTTDLESACESMDMIVLSVPSVFTRVTARAMKPFIAEKQIIVNVAKGIEESTLMTLVEQIEEEIPQADVAVLSGPSHAEEVSRQMPTTCVVGAKRKTTAELIQKYFMSRTFRVYTSPDVIGIELGGSLKNVIALAAGIADGYGCGDNTKAALITRGIHEIARLGEKMGGHSQTFYGLTGVGDLIVTCASMHSRNRRAGILIGQGYSMEEAMKEVNMVVEGVYSAKAARTLGEMYHVEMPIVEQVNQVLFEGKPAGEAIVELMERDKRIEISNIPWNE